MDYLKAFTIGTSGPVWFHHIALLALTDEKYYNYSFKIYSLLAPIYYGLMNILSVYLGQTFDWSLQKRLMITSIISIILVLLIIYKIKAYNLTPKEEGKNIINHILRHLVAFNIIIYYFTKYFSYWPLKVFIIGSSIFSYFISYLKVIWLDSKNKLNYNYKFFAAEEPFTQGFDLLISLYIYQKLLGFNLKSSLLLWNIISSFIQLFLAYNLKTYKFTNIEWIYYLLRIILTGFIKMIPIYYLLTNLK